MKIGSLFVPTDGKGRMWVYFTAPAPERSVPVWRIFEKDFDPRLISGSIVFVGTSASGLKDLRATPLNPVAPGVEVHANVVEQILHKAFLQRPDWATGAEVIYMLVLGSALLILHGVAQDEVRNNEQRHDEVRRKPRLPLPPHAPRGASPQIARDHRQDDEE